ncbi:MAG TPA: EfeM/EfeO family lipoprotein [Solirubrobacteraceae bacterium]|nr:EfeM/EfeO family lipoprotein [Solirubrobacteraceae bacterium]
MKLVTPAAAVLLAACATGCGSAGHTQAQPTRKHPRAPSGRTVPAGVSQRSPDSKAHARVSASYVEPVATIQLAPPLAQYTLYVDRLAERLPGEVSAIESAAESGDLTAAEATWLPAHITYLEIGQDDAAYGSFGDLGEQIDGLADGLPDTVANSDFSGFHKVELDLWRDHDTTAAASDAKRLLELVDELTPATIASDLPVQTVAVDGWVLRCHEILEDALRDSLSQDDDYGSNTDLASISADVRATREMLKVLAPLIEPRMPKILPTGSVDLQDIDRAITAAGGSDTHRNLSSLPVRQRQALNEAVDVATETLAPVSEILQVSTPGS